MESGCDRYGLSSSLYAVCGNCGMKEFLATGYHNTNDTLPRSNQGKDINRRIVYASYEMGVGKEGIAKLCEVLNMPFSMAKLTWYNHEDMLFEAHQDVVLAMLEKNREEARKIAFEEDGVDKNDTTLAEVPVSFDGTWSKRGFTANHGISFLISASTGKVLDYECISKVCNMCFQKKATLSEEEFDAWQEQHACDGNYGGSSPSMELEAAKRIWGRSQDYNLRYKYMICDGDSKSYSAIWNFYGVCDLCNKNEELHKSPKEYEKWQKTEEYKEWDNTHLTGTANCNRVIKLDCIGHVQKRLGKALYEFQRSASKLEDGKPVKGRQGRLTKTAIEKLKKYYGKAIRNNVTRDISSAEERDIAVKNMQQEIKAGLYHCTKLPDKERHKYCPPNSWCKFKKGLKCDDKPHHLDPVFIKHLEPIYDRLSDPALLSRCLPGYTQNANESINALVWNICPKHRWYGKKRVAIAAASAALHFSCGAKAKHDVMEKAGIGVGTHTETASKRRDSERVSQAEKRSNEKHKKYRLARSQARKRDENMRIQKEGTTYEAGAFNL